VETNLDSLDVETRTRILSQAAAYPMVESAAAHYKTQLAEVVTAKDAKIAELQSQIDAMSAATPNLGTKSPSAGIDDGIEPDAKGSFNFGRNIIQR